MTVREFIEILSKVNPDLTIYYSSERGESNPILDSDPNYPNEIWISG